MSEEYKQYFDIQKLDNLKQIVYGRALVPDKIDKQNDFMSASDIEETAHNFLINLQKAYVELLNGQKTTTPSQIGFMHKVFKGVGGFGYIVESYIDPTDGSWILATKVTDSTIWKMIVDGKITGYSVGGRGRRIPQDGGTLNG